MKRRLEEPEEEPTPSSHKVSASERKRVSILARGYPAEPVIRSKNALDKGSFSEGEDLRQKTKTEILGLPDFPDFPNPGNSPN